MSRATVLRAVARGLLKPTAVTPGGHRRFLPEDIEAFGGQVEERTRRSELVSSKEAARLLGVSQHTVIRACRDGHLVPDEVTPGGHRRFAEGGIRKLAPLAGELVGTGSAARALGLTVEKLRRAVSRGSVTPATVTPGGHRRFAKAQLASNGVHSNGDAQGQSVGHGLGHGDS